MGRSGESGCTKIIIAIIGAIATIGAAVVGGPLIDDIIDYFNNDDDSPSVPGPSIQEGGPLFVTATADPGVVGPGQWANINVLVLSDQGQPVSGANVTIQSGGGQFQKSGTATDAGQTGKDGVYRARWKCDQCAASYEMIARATKLHFMDGERPVTVFIQ